jgi:ribose transport system substrate-binding protein
MKKWFAILSVLVIAALVMVAIPAPVLANDPAPYDKACKAEDVPPAVAVDKMPTKPLRIAILVLENDPFWFDVKNGAMKAKEELAKYNTTVDWINVGERHTTDVFGQAIEAAVTQKYDAIATIAGDAGIVPYINKAAAAGVAVATFNADTDEPNKRLFFVGANSYLQGEVAGKAMAELLGGKGKVAIITGFFAVEHHELRRKGLEDYLKKNNPDIQIVGAVECQDNPDIAYTQAQDFMTAHPDLGAIYVTAGGNHGAAKAVFDAGKTGKVKMITYNFFDEIMEYVVKGTVSVTLGQDPYAQGHDPAVRLFNYLVTGQYPECGRYLTKVDQVTSENASKFWSPTKHISGTIETK